MALPSRRLTIIAGAGLVVLVGVFVLLNRGSSPPVVDEALPGTPGEFAFHAVGELHQPCIETCRSVLLDDGRVLILNGGEDAWTTREVHAEVFDPTAWTFKSLGTIPSPCNVWLECNVTVLADGSVLLLTGHEVLEQDPFDPTETYYRMIGIRPHILDPDSGRNRTIDSTLESWESVNESALLPDGRVLFAGLYATQARFRGLGLYDPEEETLTRVGLVDQLEGQLSLLPLPDGRVLAFSLTEGGVVFDPADDSVSRVGTGVPTNMLHAPLGDGRHLVMPTNGARGSVFDTATFTFSPVESAPSQVVALHSIDDGRVLAATPFGEPWMVFDAATGSFVTLDGTSGPFSSAGSARLADGRLLFGSSPGETVIFDPVSNQFVPGPDISGGRAPSVLLGLGDGRVIVLGLHSEPLGVAVGIEGLRGQLDGLLRSGEMLVEGGSTRPSGCCAADPPEFILRSQQHSLRPSEAEAFVAGDLSFVLTAPEGSLVGVTGAGYFAEVHIEDPTESFWFSPRTVSEPFDPIPVDCAQGCQFHVPGDPESVLGLGLGPEGPDVADLTFWMQVGVYLIYEGAVPAGAEDISVAVLE